MENKNIEWNKFAEFKTGDNIYDATAMDIEKLTEFFKLVVDEDDDNFNDDIILTFRKK